jgi:hypothetical protein
MLDETLRNLLAEVSECIRRFDRHEPFEAPRHHLEILALFDRCRRLFRAIQLLLEHGFAPEAIILTRPLFTESLMLAELAACDETRRVEPIIGWSLDGLADFEGMAKEAAARGDDPSEELEAIAKRRAQLEGYARRHGAQVRRWKPEEKTLAEAHGRGDEYIDFRLTHHFVHGSTLAVSQLYTKVDDETAMVGGPYANFELWGPPTALYAADSMLYAARATCHIFQWSEPPELAILLERVDQMRASLERPDPTE